MSRQIAGHIIHFEEKNLDNFIIRELMILPVETLKNRNGMMNKFKEISKVLAVIDDEKLIEKFFKSILTDNEVNEISLRWELVKLLDDGVSQRNISRKLGISLCKITRGSKELKKKPSAFKALIQKYKELKTKN